MKKNQPDPVETILFSFLEGASIDLFPSVLKEISRVMSGLTAAVKTLKFKDGDEYRHPLMSLMALHKNPQMMARIADLLIWGDEPDIFTADIRDNGLSTAELLAAGAYIHVDEPIVKMKPPKGLRYRYGERIHMLGGRDWDSTDVILAALKIRKYRLATVREVLCVGAQHPKMQERQRIVALDMKGEAGKKGGMVVLDNNYYDPKAPEDKKFPLGRSVNYESDDLPTAIDWIAAVRVG